MATSTTKSVVFIPTLTNAGKAAALAASNDGLSLKIDAVSFGSQAFNPTGGESTFPGEIKRVPVASAARVSNNQIRMTAIWPADNSTGTIQSIGFWAGTTLVATWSRTTGALGSKTAGVAFVLVNDIVFDQLPSGSINVSIDPDTAAVYAIVAAHESATNPHPGYILSSAFDGLYGGGAMPLVNGQGAIGTSKRFAREDHVHPTDTSRAPVEAPNFTGAAKMAGTLAVAGLTTLATLTATGLATFADAKVTGQLNVPTQAAGNNTTLAASTAFVSTAISNLVNGAGSALDTLNELATALGNDPNFATTISNALALKAPLASPNFTGSVNMAGTLGVNGAATFASTLAVTGAASLSGNATVGGTLGVTGKLTTAGDVAIGGTSTVAGWQYLTGAAFMFQPSTAVAARMEIGYIGGTATAPYIDFHSGATAVDFDTRLIASGGNGANGGGTLTFNGATFAVAGTLKTTGEVQTTNGVGYRQVVGNYGTFWYNDGAALYLLMTANGDPYGTFNSLRPFAVNLATGQVYIANGLTSSGPTTLQDQTTLTTSGQAWGLTVQDTGVNGATIKMVGNGATTPGKYLRVKDGSFVMMNSAYSANIFTLSDAGTGVFAGEVQSTSNQSFRIVQGNYGTFWRNDGTNLWLMLTDSGSPYGGYNALRPMRVGLADGKVIFGNDMAVAGLATFDSAITVNNQANIKTSGSSTSLVITDTGGNGANIKLVGNGATTPNKHIRANAGSLQVINSDYSAQLFTLSDAGNAWFAGTLSAAGATTLNSTLYVKGDTTLGDGGFVFTSNTLSIKPSGMNAGFELGDTRSGTASTPFIDFHSGATAVDWDFRIIAGGGNGQNSGGYLSLLGASLFVNPVTWFYKPVNVQVQGATSGVFVSGDAGQYRMISYRTANSVRWETGADSGAEGGNNAGSNYYLNRFADDGSYIDTPWSVTRQTGVVNVTTMAVGTGITMPTLARGDSSNKGATTAFVQDAVSTKGVTVRITSSTTWVCPAGVTTVWISACGGGGGGAGGGGFSSAYGSGGGGGGGAGSVLLALPFTVTPGATYTISIGAGGAAGTAGSSGNNGGNASSGGTTVMRDGSNSVMFSLAGGGGGIGGTTASGAGGQGGSRGGSCGTDSKCMTQGQGAGFGGDGGAGASGPFGVGGGSGRAGQGGALPATAADGFGTGGGGGGAGYASSSSGSAGTPGMPGIVIIEY
jgi:hypothetical protein